MAVIIKVKLWGKYRTCELLRIYRGGQAVDVRILRNDCVSGMPSIYRGVSIESVHQADRWLCQE